MGLVNVVAMADASLHYAYIDLERWEHKHHPVGTITSRQDREELISHPSRTGGMLAMGEVHLQLITPVTQDICILADVGTYAYMALRCTNKVDMIPTASFLQRSRNVRGSAY